jgi:ribosomal protein S18 acetylase RimI-like enzyme
MTSEPPAGTVTVRTATRPGDLGGVVALHGTVYAGEFGFGPEVEGRIAVMLGQYALAPEDPRRRMWIADRGGRVVGCVAIVPAGADTAQLRWFITDPAIRGSGIGRRLLTEAVAFSREAGYRRIVLWTVSTLSAALRLYGDAGFTRIEARPGVLWGAEVVEEQYELRLA